MKLYTVDFKSILFAWLLFFPIACRLLLPSSIEESLTFSIFYYPLFLPEIVLFFLLFIKKIELKNKRILVISLIGILYILINSMIIHNDHILDFFFSGTDFFFSLFFFHLFKFNNSVRRAFYWPIFLTFNLLGIQLLLFSLNIVSYEGMNIIDEYEGVIRFSTTAGASTGTSIVLFMLGYILYSLTSFRYQKYILILSLLYIIFTLSRGALFAEFLLLIYLLVKKYFNFSFIGIIKLISVLISFILFFLAINYFTGIFDSLSTRLERSNKIELNEDNSRYFRWLLAYDDFNNSPLIGNGSGYMVPYNRAKYTNIESKGYYSPHNSYLMILVDYGLIGFVIFILSIYFLWLKIKNNNFMYEIKLTFYIVVFFFMNIEVVFLNVEYIVLLLILLEMDSFNIKQNCNNLIQN